MPPLSTTSFEIGGVAEGDRLDRNVVQLTNPGPVPVAFENINLAGGNGDFVLRDSKRDLVRDARRFLAAGGRYPHRSRSRPPAAAQCRPQ
jgi:hypothetical protein